MNIQFYDMIPHPKNAVLSGWWKPARSRWTDAGKPYYNVYPGIIPALLKVKLDIDPGVMKPPLPSLLVRLPKCEHPLSPIQFILMTADKDSFLAACFKGEFTNDVIKNNPIIEGLGLLFRNYRGTIEERLQKDWPLTSTIVEESENHHLDVHMTRKVFQLCLTLCLLENDPSIIEPIPLAVDKDKYDETHDSRLIEKAKRRGNFGFSVGRQVETMPHIRRPHFAVRWLRLQPPPAALEPRVRPIKGSVVHKEVVSKIPTGYGSP